MRTRKGFSLTELVMTIAIIVILATVSGPIYNSYSTKSKMAEGYLLLGTIKDAHLKWRNDTGQFYTAAHEAYSVDYTSYLSVLGIDARANKYYTWFTANAQIRRKGGDKTFIAVVKADRLSEITMICPDDGPTTIR